MKTKTAILVLLACLLTSCIKEKQTAASLDAGSRLPDFTVVMSDGTSVTAGDLDEGVWCIMFFTTACPDCCQTLPHMQRIYDEYLSKGVRFALISREEGQESISAYWSRRGFTMPYSAQEDRRIYELFANTRVPRIYISRDGVIMSVFTDQPSNPTYEILSAALDKLL